LLFVLKNSFFVSKNINKNKREEKCESYCWWYWK